MNTQPKPVSDAKRALVARGFGTFKRWAKENRKGAALHRQKGNRDLLAALDYEYTTLIKPNL